MSTPSNEILYCWEQIRKTNRLFRITQVYAPDTVRSSLLPLYALLSSIEQICSSIDEEVARRKLDWWRQECLHRDMRVSDHPIVRELCRTGADSRIAREDLSHLLEGAEARLDADAPANLEELREVCEKVGRPQVEMEISISGDTDIDARHRSSFAQISGLVNLIRESSGQGRYWWIPLRLLAHHGLGRSEITGPAESIEVGNLFTDVFQAGQSWGKELPGIHETGAGNYLSIRHLVVNNGLNLNKLKLLEGRSPRQFFGELNRLRPLDMLQAWRLARRVSHS